MPPPLSDSSPHSLCPPPVSPFPLPPLHLPLPIAPSQSPPYCPNPVSPSPPHSFLSTLLLPPFLPTPGPCQLFSTFPSSSPSPHLSLSHLPIPVSPSPLPPPHCPLPIAPPRLPSPLLPVHPPLDYLLITCSSIKTCYNYYWVFAHLLI